MGEVGGTRNGSFGVTNRDKQTIIAPGVTATPDVQPPGKAAWITLVRFER
jgi:hypothetical protein